VVYTGLILLSEKFWEIRWSEDRKCKQNLGREVSCTQQLRGPKWKCEDNIKKVSKEVARMGGEWSWHMIASNGRDMVLMVRNFISPSMYIFPS